MIIPRMDFLIGMLLCVSITTNVYANNHNLDLDPGTGTGTVIGPTDPESPSSYSVRVVVVDAKQTRVLVQYDMRTVGGTVHEKRLARFSIRNDLSRDYKLAMLMLLRDSMSNSGLPVYLTIVPDPNDSNALPIIQAVAITRS